MIIDELIAILSFEIEGEDKLSRFRDALDKSEKHTKALAQSLSNVALVVGGAFVTGLSSIAASVVSTGAKFETLGVRLEALEGSAEKGQAALGWIRDFAEKTPLSLLQTADAYAQLRNFGIDPTNGSLMAAVDSMAMAGKGMDHLMGITLAMGQAWTRGKLYGQDALQLINRGIPVWQLLSQEMGITAEQVNELSQKGKLGRKELQMLFDAMGRRAAGASDKMSRTWAGMMARLGDKWEDFNLRIAEAGAFEAMADQLRGLMDTIDKWSKDGSMDRVAKKISASIEQMMRVIGLFAERTATHISFLIRNFETLEPWLKGFGYLLLAATAYARPLITALFVLGLVIEDFLTYLEGGESVFGDFVEGLKSLLGIPERAAAELVGLAAIISAVLLPTILRIIPRLGGLLVSGLLRFLIGPAGLILLGAEIAAALLGIDLFDVGVKMMQSLIAGMMSLRGHLRAITDSIFGEGHSDEMQKIVDATPTAEGVNLTGGEKAKAAGTWWEWFGGSKNKDAADGLSNFQGNMERVGANGAAAAIPSTVNDSRDQSQTVNVTVGGVTVQGVQNVTPAVGAAVGQAVGNSAAGAVPPSRVINQGSAF